MKEFDKFIIITTIFNPTEAVKKFSQLNDFKLIVVGDKKTPLDWAYNNTSFIAVSDQEKLEYNLAKMLPYNHYCRKMIGYIFAIKMGAKIIIDTDDDNIPKENWIFPDFKGQYPTTKSSLEFINIYKCFTEKHIWPRGFPLNRITDPKTIINNKDLVEKKIYVGVWQGLADGDPDVDAIYRLTNNQLCYFETRDPIVLDEGTLCPFNSQNTAFHKELFPLLYLPAFVNFRFTDILRGLVAQPIMWLKGFHLGFINSTVIQERNPHNYVKDFESEIPCYLLPEKIVDIVQNCINSNYSISENLVEAYKSLNKHGIVTENELYVLYAWLKDIS